MNLALVSLVGSSISNDKLHGEVSHAWNDLFGQFLERPDTSSDPESCFMFAILHSRLNLQNFELTKLN